MVKVCERRKLVFIHITKTAGVAVGAALGFGAELDGARHDVKGSLAETHRDYLRICFVRNPWARALSGFLYTRRMTEAGKINGDPARLYVAANPQADFQTFVAEFLARQNVGKILHFREQMFWIRRGRPQFIGRVESLPEDLATLSRIIGEPLSVVRLNAAEPGPTLLEAYDDRTAKTIARIYRNDIRFLNYRFPDAAGLLATLPAPSVERAFEDV